MAFGTLEGGDRRHLRFSLAKRVTWDWRRCLWCFSSHHTAMNDAIRATPGATVNELQTDGTSRPTSRGSPCSPAAFEFELEQSACLAAPAFINGLRRARCGAPATSASLPFR